MWSPLLPSLFTYPQFESTELNTYVLLCLIYNNIKKHHLKNDCKCAIIENLVMVIPENVYKL